jgi:diacylglycerol O-acyltransferase
MTVQSYDGNLDFGFIACRELVPDVWDMCGYLHDAMRELLEKV